MKLGPSAVCGAVAPPLLLLLLTVLVLLLAPPAWAGPGARGLLQKGGPMTPSIVGGASAPASRWVCCPWAPSKPQFTPDPQHRACTGPTSRLAAAPRSPLDGASCTRPLNSQAYVSAVAENQARGVRRCADSRGRGYHCSTRESAYFLGGGGVLTVCASGCSCTTAGDPLQEMKE